ncbi:BglG family transcription antiterminator [Garciella nitratireducens]|uniref:BglG family transcription antiterminator n=1 Tax=Garciella nitratireducens TaxID=218205 RepID=UPI001BD4406A|nr:BglG family transcription antiterminator [Garciella nitratireducens]
MNIRLQKIIKYLMSADKPITSCELASQLQVSAKTVRNDIKELNEILKKTQAYIESQRGKGYQLIIKEEKTFHKFVKQTWKDTQNKIPSDFRGRIQYLMEKLLFNSEYIKIEDLADELYVSRSTLKNDLKSIRKILKKYHLSLEHKPYYGLKIVGDEMQFRYCISEYLYNQKSTLMDHQIENMKILSKEQLSIIKNSVLLHLRRNHIFISDISLQNLITHIAIACKRIQEKNSVEMKEEHLKELKNKKEFLVAEHIAKDLYKQMKILFSEHEKAYLTIHLQGTKLTNSLVEKQEVISILEDEIQQIVKEMLHRIDEKYDLGLQQDEELLIAICLHLKPAINRYKYHMNIRNPMLEEIKSKYPLSFDAALIGAEVLSEKMKIRIDENEIGYLALHIEVAQERKNKNKIKVPRCLIVCASGFGSAQLLLYKLQRQFPDQLNILGTTEYYNLMNQSFHNLDFIISTIPIHEKLPIPVIEVSTILGDSDLTKIKKMILHKKAPVEKYLKEKYTYFQKDFHTPKEVIEFICEELKQDGKVDNTYVKSVFKREKYSPTSFGNMVAIPHPIEPQTKETFWCVVTLKKPIQWGNKSVQLVVLLNISKEKKQGLHPMHELLIRLLDNKEMVNHILKCKNYQQLRQMMKRI